MVIGTLDYMAPEVHETRTYDAKCDIWSLGSVLYHLMYLKEPFPHTNTQAVALRQIKGGRPPMPDDDFSPELIECLQLCLQEDPVNRVSAMDLLRQPIFANEIQHHLSPQLRAREFPVVETYMAEPAPDVDDEFRPEIIENWHDFEQWMQHKYGEEVFQQGYQMVKTAQSDDYSELSALITDTEKR